MPGTYSLFPNSVDEEVARDFICSGEQRVTVVVTDATCLERNLNLVLQVMEITDKVVLCVNLLDEAKRKGIQIDLLKLSEILGVPVIATNARDGEGLEALKDVVYQVATGELPTKPLRVWIWAIQWKKHLACCNPCVQKIYQRPVTQNGLRSGCL